MAHEVTKNGIGAARENQHELRQISSGNCCRQALEVSSRCTAIDQIARGKAFDDDVAESTRGNGGKSTGFQRDLMQLIRRHAGRPQVEQRLGLVDEPEACL